MRSRMRSSTCPVHELRTPRCATCSQTESKFLQATKGFQAGKQVMTDEEYDQLKKELRKKGSKVTAQARFLPALSSHECNNARLRRCSQPATGHPPRQQNRCTLRVSRGMSCAW